VTLTCFWIVVWCRASFLLHCYQLK